MPLLGSAHSLIETRDALWSERQQVMVILCGSEGEKVQNGRARQRGRKRVGSGGFRYSKVLFEAGAAGVEEGEMEGEVLRSGAKRVERE
jgi:hypothetical protein